MLTDAQRAALALGRQKGTNHLRGIPKSEESKRKRSVAMKAWCAANPDKVKQRASKNSGPNNYRWNGGSSRLNVAIRRLTEHRRWMDAVVRRDGTCSTCGADTDLEAHHITPFAVIIAEHGITTREQARECASLWDLSNGITLCERCHCAEHGRKYTPIGHGRRKQPRKQRCSMKGEGNPNYKGGPLPKTCSMCGAIFNVKRCRLDKRTFCSRRCVNESQRRNVQTVA